MRIDKVMHQPVVTCSVADRLDTAARLMWEKDCGALPVVEADGRVIAMITDRDICMAAYTKGLPLNAIPVRSAMSDQLFACHPEDSVSEAEKRMGEKQVRRLPVVDADGRVVGILTLNDLAREAARFSGARVQDANLALVRTLTEVGAPHSGRTHFA
jgi:CBS domain-containing protein